MIFSKKLKMFSAAVSLITVLVFSASVLAAAPTFTTETVYNAVDGTITVTSVVTAPDADDQISYFVTEADAISEGVLDASKVVYASQQAVAAGATSTFSFTTTADEGTLNAVIKSGSMNSVTVAPERAGVDNIVTYDVPVVYHNVTVIVGAGGSVTPNTDVEVESGETQTFNIVCDDGFEVDKIIFDGEEQVVASQTSYTTPAITKDLTVEFSFKTSAILPEITSPDYTETAIGATPAENSVTTFATAIAGTDSTLVEYGILFSATEGELDEVDPSTVSSLSPMAGTVRKFMALASNALGQYGIKIVDGGSNLVSDKCYSRAYMIYNNGTEDIVVLADKVNEFTLD